MSKEDIKQFLALLYELEGVLKAKRAQDSKIKTVHKKALQILCEYIKHHNKSEITYKDIKYTVERCPQKSRLSEKRIKESISEVVDSETAQKIFENIDKNRGVTEIDKIRKKTVK